MLLVHPRGFKTSANNPTEEVKPRDGTHLVLQLPLTSVPGLCLCPGDSEGFPCLDCVFYWCRGVYLAVPFPPSPGTVSMAWLHNGNYCRST